MTKFCKLFIVSLLLIYAVFANAGHPVTPTLDVTVFVSSTCPYCKQADVFLKQFQATHPWLKVDRYVINESIPALDTFNRFLENDVKDFIVPSLFFCDIRWKGFNGAPSANQLSKALIYCYEQSKNGKVSTSVKQHLEEMSVTHWWESTINTGTSFSYALVNLAVVDGLNAPTTSAIIVLFALLITQQKKWRVFFAFMLPLVALHLGQQIDSALFYSCLPFLRIPCLLIGLIVVWFVIKRITKTNIVLLVAFLLGCALEVYIQIALPSFSLIFHELLLTQGKTPGAMLLYSLLYQFIYLITISLFVAALYLGSRIKYFNKKRDFVNELSWQLLFLYGLLLIIMPYWIMRPLVMICVLAVASAVSWYIPKMNQ